MSIDFDKIREHCKEHGHCTWSDAYALITEVERLRKALEETRTAIRHVAQVTDENRLGWALKAINEVLK